MLFSAIWIIASDWFLLLLFEDVDQYRSYSTIKGLFFIVISTAIIHQLVIHEVRLWKDAQHSINRLEMYDILTGLHNRLSYTLELERIAQEKQSVTVLLSDINGLKLFNEIYGSATGDKLLVHYASILQDVMPEDAFLARIGGDEFVALIPDCDINTIADLTHELDRRIVRDPIDEFEWNVAIGTSSSCADGDDLDNLIQLAEDRMYKNKLLLQTSAANSIITSLKTTLFERSDETEQHAERIQAICAKLGQHFAFTTTELDELRLFALLHDIGKIGISDTILNKPGKLTTLEYNKMKQHPAIGYKMASSVLPLEGIAHLILTHHEWYDGNGYPKGITGDQIPFASRILAVADAYDAMTNDRVYRKAVSHEEAIAELKRMAGTQFDPSVVEAFVQLFPPQSAIL
jgi:diguanylate cyclase (GGDEF)-like protein